MQTSTFQNVKINMREKVRPKKKKVYTLWLNLHEVLENVHESVVNESSSVVAGRYWLEKGIGG